MEEGPEAARDARRPQTVTDLGWWVIPGDVLLALLRRAHAGEDPDLLYAEEYVNCDHEHPADDS